MKNSLETRLGIFFALAMCAAVLLIETIGGANFFRKGYQITAYFRGIQDLKTGDPVKLAGVRIGSVSKIDLTNDVVEVSMKIDQGRTLRTTTKARVKFAGLMGQNFVDLDFGTPDGIPIDPAIGGTLQTVEQPDFNVLMARMENVAKGVEDMTKSFSGDSLNSVLGPMADFMRDNSPKIGAILGDMQVVSEQIAVGRGSVGRMVMDEALYDEAVGAVTSISKSMDKVDGMLTDMADIMTFARTTMGEIEEGKGTMGMLLQDEALYDETTAAMTNLREIMEKMNLGKGTVGNLINEADFLSTLTLTLQKVEKATDSLEDQGPLSIIGMAFGKLVKF